MFYRYTSFLLYSLLLAGCMACTTSSVDKNSLTLESVPKEFLSKSDKTLVVASTFNFYGALEVNEMAFPKARGHDLSIKVGGKEGISAYLKVLRERFPDSLLFVDSGQIFHQNRPADLEKIIRFYEKIGHDGLGINQREYVLIKESKIKTNLPFIGSNFVDIRTNNHVQETFIRPYRVISRNDIKVAIIGLNFPSGLRPTNNDELRGKIWEDPVLSILKIHSKLQRDNIDFTIVLAQALEANDIEILIKRLPSDMVDLVVAGGIFEGPQQINGVPVLYSEGRGQYMETISLHKNDNGDKFVSQSFPVKLCHLFYQATNDCYFPKDRDSLNKRRDFLEKSNFKTVEARFLDFVISDYL